MFIYQNRKYNLGELRAIFKQYNLRSAFIADYEHWHDDGNINFYTEFADRYISDANVKNQEDAIEVSIRANIYKNEYLACIQAILFSRKHYWIKLICLDWLSNFASSISKEPFISLNFSVLQKRELNELNKIQALLNVLQVDPKPDLLNKLFKSLQKAQIPGSFYRVINNITNNKLLFNSTSIEIKNVLAEIISENTILSIAQKHELNARLN